MGQSHQGGPLVAVGKVARPHGLHGAVVVEQWSNLEDRLAPGSVVVGAGRRLTVAAAQPHGRHHLVRFEEVGDREGAEALRGVVLEAEAVSDPSVLWVHELVGATLVTTDGRPAGVVAAVEANPASDLLVTEEGTLIPLTFVVELTGDRAGRTVVVDPPAGLLD